MSASENSVREFAREFPTPNVKRAIALCEEGTLTWNQVETLFTESLKEGLAKVS